MSEVCAQVHALARRATQHTYPFDVGTLPLNGIYVLFERGEECHGGPRIARVGTHRGDGELPSRMLQHFVNENKDRSIFRKHIGRALLNRAGDSYLTEWNHDRTSRAGRERHGEEPDLLKRRAVEADVTAYMRERFSFAVFKVDAKENRLSLESKLISTVSRCDHCGPSADWLGLHSPTKKIQTNGLWLVNELGKVPLGAEDLSRLATLVV